MIKAGENIFLVGMTGAGKTTLGQALALALGKSFVDADHEMAARSGQTVPQLFEDKGEAFFRDYEHQTIAGLSAMRGIVLATGGGAVMHATTRELLRQRGMVVYLRRSIETIARHIGHQRDRPILKSEDLDGLLRDRLRLREPCYLEVADLTIDGDSHDTAQSIALVCAALGAVQP